jgi:hypothetical protein
MREGSEEVTGKALLVLLRAVALGCALVWALLNFELLAGWLEAFVKRF